MEENTKKPMSAKKIAIIAVCAVLAVCIAAGAIVAITVSQKKKEVINPILELEDGTKIPLSFYELMLSRTKASIAREMGSEKLSEFFASESVVKGKTNEEYYNEMVLESCKYYLVALSLFESERVELPQSLHRHRHIAELRLEAVGDPPGAAAKILFRRCFQLQIYFFTHLFHRRFLRFSNCMTAKEKMQYRDLITKSTICPLSAIMKLRNLSFYGMVIIGK